MSYKPELTYCPVCGVLKSPTSTVCRNCYNQATREAGRSTPEIRAWVEKQKAKVHA